MGRFADLPDEELLALTPREPEAFGAFYERHVRLVMGYLVRATGDTERALDLCTALGDFRRRDDAPRGTSGGGCYAPTDLARILSRRTAICCGSEHGPTRRIYDGFAAGDVVAMRFLMEDGTTVDARLTPPWTPDAPGAEPLRLFVAVDERDIDVGGDGVQMDEIDLIHGPRYRVEADLSDGRTVEVDTPGSG